MKRRSAALLLLLASPALAAVPTNVDIGSNGAPTISGNLGGSVTGNPSPLSDLSVTINFGEISPLNASPIIRVVVPIAIRSTNDYELRATVSGFTNTASDPYALKLTDIGFGIQNLAPAGANARICANTASVIAAPFNNDPGLTVNVSDRATYPATLANITNNTLVISGPKLSNGPVNPRKADNGWGFNAIFTVVPQFFTPGSASVTVTFTISDSLTDTRCR